MAEQNTQMDARGVVRYANATAKQITQECIQTAFLQLLEQKEMDRITISEIVRRAGVSRTAFYAHYRSKEDVLKSALGFAIDRIIELAAGNPREAGYWLPVFREAKQYTQPLQLLLKAGLGDQILSEVIERVLAGAGDDPRARYQEILWGGAVYSVITHWLRGGAVEPPEEMAAICEAITESF